MIINDYKFHSENVYFQVFFAIYIIQKFCQGTRDLKNSGNVFMKTGNRKTILTTQYKKLNLK